MPRTILVTEGDSPLGATLVRLFLARGYTVITTRQRVGVADGGASARTSLAVAWNRRSPVSAHTALLTALNAFETIDEALLLEPPVSATPLLEDTSSADIELAMDNAKGPAFLGREMRAYFLRQNRGVLAWVSLGPTQGALQGAARECFRGLASAVLAEKATAGIIANGFKSETNDMGEYGAFIDKALEEKARSIAGRWFTCPGRGGFLQNMLSGPARKS